MGVWKVGRSLLLLILLVVGLYFVANSITNYTGYIIGGDESYFESCLKGKDIVLYVENYDIVELKKMKTAEFLGSVEVSGCVLNKVDCLSESITSYPTWIIEGVKVQEDIDIFKLADLADCEMV